ncbi:MULTISPECIES: aminoglycoside N(3)-acetyltransferase [Halolamina]|uniref:Aminoglycoside 3-N-acetyltransferase n=1 Tax=Halolamina pelagica TaxID=699431 RepID=A0A1I5STN5_9EURY|nr:MULTISPECIES: AAC(3) family N-acetyltransferase [Halolamina]NHX36851.1 AAC(3) family N-acetyltransferase [Halolamina sp. R1-12]SFP74048.1 aminoglycoside 3-N-acetyltransferase [Halolamina pelagica]
MDEHAAVDAVDDPVTVDRIAADLRELGVDAGDTLLVHSALSELGWVAGGPQAVVDALQRVVTESGTVVVPTHSTQYSDPSVWTSPPVPDDWIPQIRESMPPYRPAVTPTRSMGAVAECFRDYPGTRRSRHPLYSFAAWGADAEAVADDHRLENGMGEHSPLARVYERDGSVLLLGTGHGTNTSLHLAEYRAEVDAEETTAGAPVLRDGEREWVEWEDIEHDSSDFPEIGAAFERERPDAVTEGEVGAATAKLVDQPALVDFAVEWLAATR